MPARAPRYWLFKSDPEVFGWEHLWAAPGRRTAWEGVRNYQARNSMRDDMKKGDGVLFYHSSADPPAIVGVAEIVGEASPDLTQFDPKDAHFDPASRHEDPRWLAVEIRARRRLPRCVSLAEVKADSALAGMLLAQRGQRLSVQPVEEAHWRRILSLGGLAGGGRAARSGSE